MQNIQGRIRAQQPRKWRSQYAQHAKRPGSVHLCFKCKRNYDKQFSRLCTCTQCVIVCVLLYTYNYNHEIHECIQYTTITNDIMS